MDLRDKIKKELRESYGNFETYLEHKYEETMVEKLYEEHLNKRLSSETLDIKRAWVTYNQVIIEFKNNLKDMIMVKKLQYRLTDVEDPKNIFIEILSETKERSPELERLYKKIIKFV